MPYSLYRNLRRLWDYKALPMFLTSRPKRREGRLIGLLFEDMTLTEPTWRDAQWYPYSGGYWQFKGGGKLPQGASRLWGWKPLKAGKV